MSDIVLKNGTLIAEINLHGAELKSLRKGNHEYMWQADPKFWGRTAPVLFPFVGAVNEGKYYHNGKEYKMGQHGFARDMDFELLNSSDNCAEFVLKSSADTVEKYPFEFELYISYELSEADGLKVNWRVVNPSTDKSLEFSIGAHPAFNCILADSAIKISKSGIPLDSFVNSVFGKGLLTDQKAKVELADGVMQLDEHTFDGDAFVLEDSQADSVAILDVNGNEVLRVNFTSPLVGIWSPPGKNAPFLCIEPWYGRADKEGFVGELKNREHNNTLQAGDSFSVSYTIMV